MNNYTAKQLPTIMKKTLQHQTYETTTNNLHRTNFDNGKLCCIQC